MMTLKEYLESCEPLPWTVVKEHSSDWLVGNHTLAINYVRFKAIMEAVEKHFSSSKEILDVGVYPGIVPQLFHEYLMAEGGYRYHALGLGFTDLFSEKMAEFGVELLECDLEPRLHLDSDRSTVIPLPNEMVDSIVFTDVIEHFYDPFYPLLEINRVSKLGAVMVLTTDNLTRLGSQLRLLRGFSCNVPLIEGSMFYDGDWRPHFREYSREELFQLLKWAGFEVVEHKYYEAEFGRYKVVNGKLVQQKLENNTFMAKLKNMVRWIAKTAFPFLKDNHIIVAKKVVAYEDMIKAAPKVVSELDEWMSQRKIFSGVH